ncbi:hypothetical protein HaLaN_16449 [Haematococcus lacustris]|uniref:Uncharacterized protein n=1 Tax=Haematococcus lacustris TaxID=44745 RepID=A0A699ZCK5_HAELA|nr:hypothetical protein HaLaN_16449 [Haematococcus lacustris]
MQSIEVSEAATARQWGVWEPTLVPHGVLVEAAGLATSRQKLLPKCTPVTTSIALLIFFSSSPMTSPWTVTRVMTMKGDGMSMVMWQRRATSLCAWLRQLLTAPSPQFQRGVRKVHQALCGWKARGASLSASGETVAGVAIRGAAAAMARQGWQGLA